MAEADLKALHEAAFGWARSCVGYDAVEAQEVMQVVYVKIMEGRARFDGRSSLKTWLFSVIRNTAVARLRMRRRRARLLSVWRRSEVVTAPRPLLEVAGASEARRRVLEALDRLPPRQREVVELVFYRDFSVEEAARVMGVSVGAARTHYARAKARLAERLKGKVTP